jgi:sigma-B regulation protein RsbU (phosphoserine phosphatase)
MAYVRGALRAQAQQCSDLGAILTALNRQLCRETEPAEFVTMLIVAVSPDRRRLYYCNAGHEPLALLRDGRTTPAGDGGLALGIQEDERFCEHAMELAAGDFVLLYTDGATEAMDYQGAAYGRERLLEALRQHGDLAPDWALRAIHWDIRRFVGLAEQTDDLTMVGLKIVSVA